MSIKHLNQYDLATRWGMSARTLERWRWEGTGPKFLKIGGLIRYRIEDVEKYEETRLISCACERMALR